MGEGEEREGVPECVGFLSVRVCGRERGDCWKGGGSVSLLGG